MGCNKKKTRTSRRSGTAVVEFALVLPIVMVLLLGAVELGRAIMVQHSLQETAHAACRVYSVVGSSQQDAADIITEAMDNAGISNYTVAYDPATKAEVDVNLEAVTVTVTVDYSDVAWLSPDYLANASVIGSCVMPADIE